MKRFFMALALSTLSVPAISSAAFVDSIGIGVSPLVSYSTSGLTDNSTFPTSVFLIGGDSSWRMEYLSYEPNLASSVQSRQYKNSAILAYYNMEFLLRARRGTILGRTRLFFSGGGGVFRSRLNTAVANSEYNFGFGVQGGFRYFFDQRVFFGGEAKYLYSKITYNDLSYEDQNIGGLFFSLTLGVRFGK